MTTAKQLYDLGYDALVKITPHDARIAPTSKIKPEMLGKVPGKWTPDGWVGYNWRAAEPVTHNDVESWGKAGVGIRTDFYPAVDIDILDAPLSEFIQQRAWALLGLAPIRVGRAPKKLLLYRTNESFGRMRLWINDEHLIEILGDGQQFVAGGIHPGTKQPYEWPLGIPDNDQLEEITRNDADKFLSAVEADLELFGFSCRREGSGALSADRETIVQAHLAGDYDRIKEALLLVPNDNDNFPGRDDYLRMGYAIKAALGDEGFDLFAEWASRWTGNGTVSGNDPEVVEADWERMQPPFEIGAEYIYETAREFGYNQAGDEFAAEALPPEEIAQAEAAIKEQSALMGGAAVKFSDAHVARVLIKQHGAELRFCPERSQWMSWDGAKWNMDNSRRATYLAGIICQKLVKLAGQTIGEQKKCEAVQNRLSNLGAKQAGAAYASDQPEMQLSQNSLDADPYLLNTPTGIVDLRTGEMSSHDPSQYMTRCTAVGPSVGPAPRWQAFLREATNGDVELQRYLQRLAGYALTGLKTEHNLAFIYGSGGNGKGVFINTITGILDSYAKAASMDTFTASKFDRHPTDMAGLAGARLVTAQETQAGRSWDEAKVKMLTSNDKVQARFMREDFFEFEPNFKLVFAGNHKPEIRNLDEAIRRRFHLVPFTVKPAKANTHLQAELKEEWPQILAWIMEGSREWFKQGLNPPSVVLEATAEYFDEEDPIGQWIRDKVIFTDDGADFVSTTALHDNYREWCGENGEHAKTAKGLVRTVRERGGFRHKRTTECRGFVGIKLKDGAGADFAAVNEVI